MYFGSSLTSDVQKRETIRKYLARWTVACGRRNVGWPASHWSTIDIRTYRHDTHTVCSGRDLFYCVRARSAPACICALRKRRRGNWEAQQSQNAFRPLRWESFYTKDWNPHNFGEFNFRCYGYAKKNFTPIATFLLATNKLYFRVFSQYRILTPTNLSIFCSTYLLLNINCFAKTKIYRCESEYYNFIPY